MDVTLEPPRGSTKKRYGDISTMCNTRLLAVLIFLVVATIIHLAFRAANIGTTTLVEDFTLKASQQQQAKQEQEQDVTDEFRHRRILITVNAYDFSQYRYFDEIFDSFRDLCEVGFHIDLVIQTSEIWPMSTLLSMQSRSSTCVHGKLNATLSLHSPEWKHYFANLHRDLFYRHLEDYDLFIYAEADLHIRARSVVGWIKATETINQARPNNHTKYLVGFIRYEKAAQSNFDRVYFEHFLHTQSKKDFAKHHLHKIPGIPDEVYWNPATRHYQGMYIATREHLLDWRDWDHCRFNETDRNTDPILIREYAASLQIFEDCAVTQVMPTSHWDDFLIHHMPDKYYRHYPQVLVASHQAAEFFPANQDSKSTNKLIHVSVDEDKFDTHFNLTDYNLFQSRYSKNHTVA